MVSKSDYSVSQDLDSNILGTTAIGDIGRVLEVDRSHKICMFKQMSMIRGTDMLAAIGLFQ